MTTTLTAAEQELSKQLNDYWSGTATSAGAAGGTTIVDTAMKAKANDWITDFTYDQVTSGTYDGEERKVSSLDNSSGTATVLAHTGQIASAVTYRIHRLFSASDKRIALIAACRTVFPHLHTQIRDTTQTAGNWLLNGDVEVWTSASYPDYWRVSAVTATATTTANLVYRGSKSCKLSTAAGYLYQDETLNASLMELRGKTVTFKCRAWCDTASCLRLGFYDGTTTTYSSYHPGTSKYCDDAGSEDYLKLEVTLPAVIKNASFRVYHDVLAGTSYVDDLRITSPARDRIYIGNLGLAQNYPHSVSMQAEGYQQYEPWQTLRNYEIQSDGYLYCGDWENDYRLRIEGTGTLDFLASGASSTLWTATVAGDQPHLDILVADAACYLYRQMTLPNFSSGESKKWAEGLTYWQQEAQMRKMKFGLKTPSAKVKWGV